VRARRGVTPVERRAIHQSPRCAGGARHVQLIYERWPQRMALACHRRAVGSNVVVDIGGGTTEVLSCSSESRIAIVRVGGESRWTMRS